MPRNLTDGDRGKVCQAEGSNDGVSDLYRPHPAATLGLLSPERIPPERGMGDAGRNAWGSVPGWQPIAPGAARVQRRVNAFSLGPSVQHGSVRSLL
jgi:hypothetical protein